MTSPAVEAYLPGLQNAARDARAEVGTERRFVTTELFLFAGLLTLQLVWIISMNWPLWRALRWTMWSFDDLETASAEPVAFFHHLSIWITAGGATLLILTPVMGWLRVRRAIRLATACTGKSPVISARSPLIRFGLHSQILVIFAYALWISPFPWSFLNMWMFSFRGGGEEGRNDVLNTIVTGWALTIAGTYFLAIFRGFVERKRVILELESA